MQGFLIFLYLGAGCWAYEGLEFLAEHCQPLDSSADYFEDSLDRLFAAKGKAESRGASSEVGLFTYFPGKTTTPEVQRTVAVKRSSTPLSEPDEWLGEEEQRPWSYTDVMVDLMRNEVVFLKTEAPRHKNMLQMFDCFFKKESDSLALYLVLEKMSGEMAPRLATSATLPFGHEAFDAFQLLPVATKLAVFRELAAQLAFIHSRGMSHNDVKPNNLMLANDEATSAKVIDFGGTSRWGRTVRSFTPAYSDYETCRFKKATAANDVWGFGQSLAEITLNERVGAAKSKSLGRYRPSFWEKEHIVHKMIREEIISRLGSAGAWTTRFGHCSFLSLVYQTLRIKHKDRLGMGRVVQWLGLLSSAFAADRGAPEVLALGRDICIQARRVRV